MTAPDPRPYAAPGDLVTAEDAAAFVRTYVVDPDTERDLSDVYNHLERRLDRERRQACERGAEDCERRLAELGPEPEEPTIDIWGTEALRARLRESALAFRAAASEVAGHLSSPDRAAARTP